MPSILAVLAVLAPLLPHVIAHGEIAAVTAGGTTNTAPNVRISMTLSVSSDARAQIYYTADAKNAKTAVTVMYEASGKAYNTNADYSDNAYFYSDVCAAQFD